MKCKDCKDYRCVKTEYGTVRKCSKDGTLLSDQDAEKEKVCAENEKNV